MKYIVFALFLTISICQSAEPADESEGEPLLGGYEEFPLEEARKLQTFIENRIQLRKVAKLIKYQKQVVNGFNHVLTYDLNGVSARIQVYESI